MFALIDRSGRNLTRETRQFESSGCRFFPPFFFISSLFFFFFRHVASPFARCDYVNRDTRYRQIRALGTVRVTGMMTDWRIRPVSLMK